MKVAVVAANGKAGKLIVKEAVDRGMDVTAIVRGENKTVALNVILKDFSTLPGKILQDLMWSLMPLATGQRMRLISFLMPRFIWQRSLKEQTQGFWL